MGWLCVGKGTCEKWAQSSSGHMTLVHVRLRHSSCSASLSTGSAIFFPPHCLFKEPSGGIPISPRCKLRTTASFDLMKTCLRSHLFPRASLLLPRERQTLKFMGILTCRARKCTGLGKEDRREPGPQWGCGGTYLQLWFPRAVFELQRWVSLETNLAHECPLFKWPIFFHSI